MPRRWRFQLLVTGTTGGPDAKQRAGAVLLLEHEVVVHLNDVGVPQLGELAGIFVAGKEDPNS